jgi:hypothetical protein
MDQGMEQDRRGEPSVPGVDQNGGLAWKRINANEGLHGGVENKEPRRERERERERE